MAKKTYVYEFYVMDFGWNMFPTVPETVEKLSKTYKHVGDRSPDHEYGILQKFLKFVDRADHLAHESGVTKGFCTDIHVMPLIDQIEPSYALVWKAGRGGWCVVVSEQRLPWIEQNENCNIFKIFEYN